MIRLEILIVRELDAQLLLKDVEEGQLGPEQRQAATPTKTYRNPAAEK